MPYLDNFGVTVAPRKHRKTKSHVLGRNATDRITYTLRYRKWIVQKKCPMTGRVLLSGTG